ncbi:hypothetical protein EVA_21133 [gut metagenome]|uniref:Uncharacterized protein n=1 Tax=gut metagenome TaxID=749906 RepID=J9FTR0_9ZZZZ
MRHRQCSRCGETIQTVRKLVHRSMNFFVFSCKITKTNGYLCILYPYFCESVRFFSSFTSCCNCYSLSLYFSVGSGMSCFVTGCIGQGSSPLSNSRLLQQYLCCKKRAFQQ